MALLNSQDQWGFPAVIAGIEIGVDDAQPVGRFGKANLRRDMERRITLIIADIGIGISPEEIQHPLRIPPQGHDMQRRFAG